MAATLRTYLELVRFSHTIFALPFAVMAAVLALVLPGAPALTRPAGRSGPRRPRTSAPTA